MSDSLLDSQILDVWVRIRSLVDLGGVTATDKMNQKDQLRKAMQTPRKTNSRFPTNMDTLVENDFPSAFVENPEIRKELLKERISEIKVKGQTRYTVKSGTQSFTYGNKTIRGGKFLSGKTIDQAYEDLDRKTSKEKANKGEEE